MNYFLPFWSSPEYRQTTDYRQKAMHMSPPCKLHRWAQKTNCRVPLKRLYCKVGEGPTCFAEIAVGWSELFSNIAVGYQPDKGKITVGCPKSQAQTPPLVTFQMEIMVINLTSC